MPFILLASCDLANVLLLLFFSSLMSISNFLAILTSFPGQHYPKRSFMDIVCDSGYFLLHLWQSHQVFLHWLKSQAHLCLLFSVHDNTNVTICFVKNDTQPISNMLLHIISCVFILLILPSAQMFYWCPNVTTGVPSNCSAFIISFHLNDINIRSSLLFEFGQSETLITWEKFDLWTLKKAISVKSGKT